MSDPEDKIDQYRDQALNQLIATIDATGGIEIDPPGSEPVPKVDPEWGDLAAAYLNACRAIRVTPLVNGKRQPNIIKVIVQLARSVNDEIDDDENERETAAIHAMFDSLHEDVEVAVVDCDDVYLYDAHRQV